MSFDPEFPTKLLNLLPDDIVGVYRLNRYEWSDTIGAFLNSGGIVVIPREDRASKWVQVYPSTSQTAWELTQEAFERFGWIPPIILRAPQEWQELRALEMMEQILEALQEQIIARPEDRTLLDLYLLLRRVGLGLWLEEQTSSQVLDRPHPEWVAEEIRLGLQEAEEWGQQPQEHGLPAFLQEPPQVQAEEDWEETPDSEEEMPPLLEDSDSEGTPLPETQAEETQAEEIREDHPEEEEIHHRLRRTLNLQRRTRTTEPR
ncbi:hypothetical protein WOLCODRAFT_155631 [Wolfiporia cocos MD-104 SS10]|uniref:Uncharacterized protein n=1 Tax=Wolfiporia cocos (strain MD-104) TaxID=742152 RepID=A0A2H3JE62_WOLCO|nr:hypothetical protein WOLCODRAFT_155631 [Wolfiporia cocos MD-104 SS10]